jgi:hypothetical protein
MTTLERPDHIVWDITYARVTDRIIALEPSGVGLAGGEALLIKGIFDVIDRRAAFAVPASV